MVTTKPKQSTMSFQLPYYIDGDVKITQSNAILRHLGRKYDMGM